MKNRPFGTLVNEECLEDDIGVSYQGSEDQTVNGATCVRWDRVARSRRNAAIFRTLGSDIDHNHCRNPDSDSTGLWCYTKTRATKGNWAYCVPVPACGDNPVTGCDI